MTTTVKTPSTITPAEVRVIAREAYLFGFPLVDNYRVQYAYFQDKDNKEFKAPWNILFNNARVYTPRDTAVQSPNSDTPYSYVGADLRTEPLVFTVPAMEKERFYHLQFIDQYTFNFAYVGTRTTGNGPGNFLLAGPRWKGNAPPGVTSVIACDTEFAFVLYRTQLFNAGDIDNVRRIQSGYTVRPLSEFLGQPAPPAAPAVAFIAPLSPEEQRQSLEFFDVLNFVLQFCPTHPTESELMARFARLGIGAGCTFMGNAMSDDARRAIEDGRADAWEAYEALKANIAAGKVRAADLVRPREFEQSNYLYRFAVAVDGIYANSKEEAMDAVYVADAGGWKMDGAHRYQLRFAPGELPPVSAFWSLTLYELPASLLSDNRLDRYLINSPMLPALKKDADGGVTLYVQHDSPGKDHEANWLPAPDGSFWVALRLYAPQHDALSGTWKQPPLARQQPSPDHR